MPRENTILINIESTTADKLISASIKFSRIKGKLTIGRKAEIKLNLILAAPKNTIGMIMEKTIRVIKDCA